MNYEVTFMLKSSPTVVKISAPSKALEDIKEYLLNTTQKGYITVNGVMINANEVAVMTWEPL